MFRRIMMILLMAVFFVFGYENYNGWDVSYGISDTLGAGEYSYTAASRLSQYEDIRVIVKCDDTTTAGFASDSVAIEYGYQTGTVTLNSAGNKDTLWDDLIVIDTMLDSDFGTVGSGTVASSGVLTHTWGGADTLSVSGYATQSRWFVPEWDFLIRFFVKGLAGNNADDNLELYLEPKRRIYIPTK